MDKSWMSRPKYTPEYIRGIDSFIEFASQKLDSRGLILCPCRVCSNRYFKPLEEVRSHLIAKGMFTGYIVWNRHGEERERVLESVNIHKPTVTQICPTSHSNFIGIDNMTELLHDTIAPSSMHSIEAIDEDSSEMPVEEKFNAGSSSENTVGFEQLLQQASQELYPGCKKYSKLSFILHLYQLKCVNSWTSTSFDMLLELLMDVLPNGTMLPKNTYEVKKLMKKFDLGYDKIDACPNDCMLFFGDKVDLVECEKCGASRWAKNGKTNEHHRTKKSAKIVRYFPLIPRLQ